MALFLLLFSADFIVFSVTKNNSSEYFKGKTEHENEGTCCDSGFRCHFNGL